MTRREFIAISSSGPAALSGGQSGSRGRSIEEQANVRVVNEFCAAWETRDPQKIFGYLADDIRFRFTPDSPIAIGRTTLAAALEGFFKTSLKIRFEVLDTFAAGPLVANVRVDYVTNTDGKQVDTRVVGAFYLKDGKIVEWLEALAPA
jgi:limonene-1,2-epoxide hydrolase